MRFPTAAERLAQSHAIEWAADWQYATVFRESYPGAPVGNVAEPPEGDGWELNTELGRGGFETITPSWSDGSKVHVKSHWRRRVPGMVPYARQAHLSVLRPT